MSIALDASAFHLLDSSIDSSPSHGSIEPWRTAQVESESAQRRAKFGAGESQADSIESIVRSGRGSQAAADEARPVVEEWVDVHMPRCGHKRMAAYAVVARMFRCHESLIRRLLGRQVTRLDADFYKRVMLSEPELRALLAARARADLARCAAPRKRGAPLHREEAPDAPH